MCWPTERRVVKGLRDGWSNEKDVTHVEATKGGGQCDVVKINGGGGADDE